MRQWEKMTTAELDAFGFINVIDELIDDRDRLRNQIMVLIDERDRYRNALANVDRNAGLVTDWTGCPTKCLGTDDKPCPSNSVIIDNLCHAPDCVWVEAQQHQGQQP